jgi:hypothetical protein
VKYINEKIILGNGESMKAIRLEAFNAMQSSIIILVSM